MVPAAGSGSRMGHSTPKQYLNLHNKPVIQHTLERLSASNVKGVAVCISSEDEHWNTLNIELSIPLFKVKGGQERCHSVLNGLKALEAHANPDDWVLVHDAARPCVRLEDINKLMASLAHHPVGGLLALPVRDTMKRSDSHNYITSTVSREGLWHALTPQMFRLNTLLEALQIMLDQKQYVTDDAQAIEKMGHCPILVEGHADNIKITHPQDLKLAELYLQEQLSHAI